MKDKYPLEYYIGKKYNEFTIIEIHTHRVSICLAQCSCGQIRKISLSELKRGKRKSCGCKKSELISNAVTTHKSSKTRLYKIWYAIKRRCYEEDFISFENYGGRGIKICKEWEDFLVFKNWAIENGYNELYDQNKCSIDRINNNGNYCPENCRWSDRKTQNRNSRHNNVLEYNGVSKCMSEWAEENGIPYGTLSSRINRYKWSIDRALTTPVSSRKI